jgi:membrane associated rhomboid family serine protease
VLPISDNAPVRRRSIVTIGLVAANVLVFVWESHAGGRALDARVLHYGYFPCTVQGPCAAFVPRHHLPPWESVFSAMFMHASWLHLGGNMLFLWIFGNNVEDVLGRLRYLLWYLVGGVAAMAAQTVVTLHEAGDPVRAASIPNVGASGAIAAVLGAYVVILPFAPVRTLPVFFLRFPAVLVIGFWFYLQLRDAHDSLVHPASGGGVAFFAHIGGFVFGALTVRFLMVRPPAPRLRRRG